MGVGCFETGGGDWFGLGEGAGEGFFLEVLFVDGLESIREVAVDGLEEEDAAVADGVVFEGPAFEDSELCGGRRTLWGSSLRVITTAVRLTASSLQTWRRRMVVLVQLWRVSLVLRRVPVRSQQLTKTRIDLLLKLTYDHLY